jgi:hypothetical protein
MRTTSVWGARGLAALLALAALVALAPGRSWAQLAGNYSPPDVQLPLPLYSTRPDVGGLFVDAGFAFYTQSNPIKSQPVAYRGFIVSQNTFPSPDGTNATFNLKDPATGNVAFQGQFIGSRALALDTNQVTGPSSFQPGFNIEAGWKFGDGSALTIGYLWLSEESYRATATLVNTPIQSFGNQQQDTFLTSFVYNYPSDFAGPINKIQTLNPTGLPGAFVPAPGAAYGIWNGASAMTLSFIQRFQQVEATFRKPFYETENYRASAVVGPRYSWIAEKFSWVTTDLDFTGASSPIYVGTYNNQVDNHMYGVHAGLQQEWYVGGGFAAMLTTSGALFADVIREAADYQRGDRGGPENKRTVRQFNIVPEVQVTPSVMWYPIEGVQIKVGYDIFAFFNTRAATTPIDFNYSALVPGYQDVSRLFQGFQANVAFVF